jgi:hypothetical protein
MQPISETYEGPACRLIVVLRRGCTSARTDHWCQTPSKAAEGASPVTAAFSQAIAIPIPNRPVPSAEALTAQGFLT